MSKCPNCGTTMSCGCQRRSLPNGKPGCSKCVNNSTPSTPPAKSATKYTDIKNSIEKAAVQRVVNNQYDSPTPLVNSAQIINKDK